MLKVAQLQGHLIMIIYNFIIIIYHEIIIVGIEGSKNYTGKSLEYFRGIHFACHQLYSSMEDPMEDPNKKLGRIE